MTLVIGPTHSQPRELQLAAALRRPSDLGTGWGVIRTLLLGAISLGTLPLLAWSIRTRVLFAEEAARLMQVASLPAREPGWPNRRGLVRQARRTRPNGLLWLLPVLIASFIIGGAIVFLLGQKYDALGHLVEITYGAGRSDAIQDPLLQTPFGIWSALLIGGYLFHLLHVKMHFSSVRRFINQLNGGLAASGVQAIALPRSAKMPGLLWTAGGLAMTAMGAWWALPMVLAGSLQRRNAFQMHRDLRKTLADRVDALMQVRALPDPRCQNRQCQAPIRKFSRFCPHCGAAVNPVFARGGIWA